MPSAVPAISDTPLWQWIPTSEFKLPAASIQTTFKTRAKTLWMLSRSWKTQGEPAPDVVSREDLESLSPAELDRVAPALDWKDYAQPLLSE